MCTKYPGTAQEGMQTPFSAAPAPVPVPVPAANPVPEGGASFLCLSLWLRIPIPSPLLPRSDQPRVVALNKPTTARSEQPAASTTPSSSSLHLPFWCFGTHSSIVSLSISHPRSKAASLSGPSAATTASHAHQQLALPRPALLRALHSRHTSPTKTHSDRTRRHVNHATLSFAKLECSSIKILPRRPCPSRSLRFLSLFT